MVQERAKDETPAAAAAPPRPDLSWKSMTIQWGTRAPVHPQGGLTLGALNVGAYGEIPDYWEDRSRMPRGSFSPPGTAGAPVGGYYLRNKSDFWADNAAELYEEAISRRWASADGLPWAECRGLRDDVELAICQVATELSQQASIEVEVVSSWLQLMSYGYHEVKVFLATENFDAGRHFEVFRKRAMVNGGGLGLESPGQVNRLLLESRAGWTETSLLLHILRGTFTRTLYRYLAAFAPTPVELLIGRRALQDASRHIAYAMQHLKYAVNHVTGLARNLNVGLAQAEAFAGRDDADPVLWEALACLFGGGVQGMDAGMQTVARLRRDYVRDYLRSLDWIGVDRRPGLASNFAALLGG
ncbi:MAG TPA: hypothetical protein VKV26_23485 [Dehalococcoidia bacterium]|nr:hypothetical protein [Dehalococcoidia bacterium]